MTVAEYTENGLSLSWDQAEITAGQARSARAVVRARPPHPSNVVRGVYRIDGGPDCEARGFPLGIDPQTGAHLFALDLPTPPPGSVLSWHPVAAISGREADPRRGGVPASILVASAPTSAAPRAAPQPGAAAPRDPRDRKPHRYGRVGPSHPAPFAFQPEFLFRVTAPVFRDENPVGETPDGLRMVFALRGGGHVDGPALRGEILHGGGDWMRVRPDGVGICEIHALIKPEGGGIVLSEYTGVVDFGPDGYEALRAGRGPRRAPLRFAPRYLTAEPSLLWMNRLQCFSVGEVDLEAYVVEYDLYAFRAQPAGS